MRVILDTAFSGFIRAKLIKVQGDYATVKITSRHSTTQGWYRGEELFPLSAVLPADHWAIRVKRGSGKLFALCTSSHNRAGLFAPYLES